MSPIQTCDLIDLKHIFFSTGDILVLKTTLGVDRDLLPSQGESRQQVWDLSKPLTLGLGIFCKHIKQVSSCPLKSSEPSLNCLELYYLPISHAQLSHRQSEKVYFWSLKTFL